MVALDDVSIPIIHITNTLCTIIIKNGLPLNSCNSVPCNGCVITILCSGYKTFPENKCNTRIQIIIMKHKNSEALKIYMALCLILRNSDQLNDNCQK